MVRQARLDVPGALHHIIGRGIERGGIFQDDVDRETFVDTKSLSDRNFHTLLRLDADSKAFSSVTQNGQCAYSHGNEKVADQICSSLQSETPPPWLSVSEPLQVDLYSAPCPPSRAGLAGHLPVSDSVFLNARG
jgi:hypothetical protein